MRQRRITNCDGVWITKRGKNFKKWITKCDGVTNRDGLQSDIVQVDNIRNFQKSFSCKPFND